MRKRKAEPSRSETALTLLALVVGACGITLTPWQQREIVGRYFTRKDDGTPALRLLFVELPKGLGKTTLAALMLLVDAAVTAALQGIVVAVDSDQARLTLRSMAAIVARVPALLRRCRVLADRIAFDNGSEVMMMAADAPSAHGVGGLGKAFRVVADELHAWPDRQLWDVLWASGGKLKDTLFLVTTNAGSRVGLYWQVRTLAASGRGRSHLYAPGEAVQAEWQTEEERAEFRAVMEATLPPALFRRYITGRPGEDDDSYLTRHQVEACIDPSWEAQASGTLPTYVGTDFGLTRDRTSVYACAWGPDTRLWVLGGWTADPRETADGEILLAAVEELLVGIAEAFPLRRVLCDPWNFAASRQRLQARLPIVDFPYGVSNQEKVSAALYRLIAGRQLRLFPDEALVDELVALQTVVTPKGFRFDHRRGGHNDRAVALGLSCFAACESGMPSGKPMPILLGKERDTAHLLMAGPRPWDRGDPWVDAPRRDDRSWFDRIQEDASAGGAHGGGRAIR